MKSVKNDFLYSESCFYFAYSNDRMSLSFEERKLQYIQAIEAEYMPAEKSWWQHPAPSYHLTSDYAVDYDKTLNSGEPVLFKKPRKERMIVAIMLVVASLLIYLVGKNDFGLSYLLFVLLLLIVVLPVLLNNKTMIRVSRDGIWLYKENKDISWKNVLLTYIKEVHGENTNYFFIVHYYNETLDEIMVSEIKLDGLVSPRVLSAAIEANRSL